MVVSTKQLKIVANKTRTHRSQRLVQVLLVCVGFPSLPTGCVSATIQVVDERTALENQILGSYEELDHDLQLVASVRALDTQGNKKSPPKISNIRKRAIAARQTQQFNLDDVTEFKTQGCLGESNQGLLVIIDCPTGKKPQLKKRLQRVVADENDARQVLFDFIITTSPDLSKADQQQLRRVWASMARTKAAKGHWIQTEQGEWIQKS